MTRRVLNHPRLRYLGGGKYGFIEAEHGEVDFRVVSSRGYETESLTEDAARYWAERWTASKGPAETYWVQTRIVGVTDWQDAEPKAALDLQGEEGR